MVDSTSEYIVDLSLDSLTQRTSIDTGIDLGHSDVAASEIGNIMFHVWAYVILNWCGVHL